MFPIQCSHDGTWALCCQRLALLSETGIASWKFLQAQSRTSRESAAALAELGAPADSAALAEPGSAARADALLLDQVGVDDPVPVEQILLLLGARVLAFLVENEDELEICSPHEKTWGIPAAYGTYSWNHFAKTGKTAEKLGTR